MSVNEPTYQQERDIFGAVPPAREPFVCNICFGPATADYFLCYRCKQTYPAKLQLQGRVIPITTALNPSPWYTKLLGYKNGFREYRATLAALFWEWFVHNQEHIKRLLGGNVQAIIVIPSTKSPTRTSSGQHLLHKTLALLPEFADFLSPALSYTGPIGKFPRNNYKPEFFQIDLPSLKGKRVLLIDDVWVTGARMVGAAGALQQAGINDFLCVLLARYSKTENLPGDSPWLVAARISHSLNWPLSKTHTTPQ